MSTLSFKAGDRGKYEIGESFKLLFTIRSDPDDVCVLTLMCLSLSDVEHGLGTQRQG